MSDSYPLADGGAAYTREVAERLRAYEGQCRSQESRLGELWGEEPPYEEQAQDHASWPLGHLFYTWLGDVMRKASREELTVAGLPRPTRVFRAYNAGSLLSRELQRQRCVEHGWDALCGTAVVRYTGEGRAAQQRVVRRALRAVVRALGWGGDGGRVAVAPSGLRVGATGVLRWCGRVQQYDGGSQRYAGVEWDATAVAAAAAAAGAGGAEGGGESVSAWHSGTVCGEHLFTTSDGRATATCECVEDVEIVVPEGAGAAEKGSGGGAVGDDGLPPAVRVRPRGMSAAAAIFRTLWVHMYRIIPIRMGRDTCTICVPLLLQYYIEYLERIAEDVDQSGGQGPVEQGTPRSWLTGVGFVVLYFFFIAAQTVTQAYYFFATFRCACSFRAALSGVIFEKCLTISNKDFAHPRINTGNIVNLLGSDVANVEEFAMWFWATIGSAAQLVAGVVLLYRLMGWSAFLGFGVMFVAVPLQGIVTRKTFEAFEEKSAATDARLKATNEFLSGIRVVKFMSWEPSFIVRINELREAELQQVKRIQFFMTVMSFLSSAIPNMVLGIVLLCFSLGGNELKASIVFPAIALEGIIEMPFFCVPMIVTGFTHFFVSMRRVTRFVECEDSANAVSSMEEEFAEEHRQKVTQDAQAAYAETRRQFLEMYAASFNNASLSAYVAEMLPSMNAKAKSAKTATDASQSKKGSAGDEADESDDAVYELRAKTLLTDVDLRIPRGQLTVVLGPTGSGKSTLLDALIGALAVTRGRVACGGRVAYVPQQPWIMNATLRDNVVFFGAADARAFERAVASSQLAADLALLADGAATEIGEKGINLSGGQKARVSLARAVYADRDVYVLDDPLSALDAHVGERVMRECVCGALAGKTRVLATHQVHVARDADYVVVLAADGRVAFQGDAAAYGVYCDLHAELPASGGAAADTAGDEAVADVAAPCDLIDAGSPVGGGRAGAACVDGGDSGDDGEATAAGSVRTVASARGGAAKLMTEEEMAEGSVTRDVYLRYMKACCRMRVWWLLGVLHVGTEVLIVSSRIWLSCWTARRFGGVSEATYLYVYLVLVMTGIVAHPIRRLCTYPLLRRGCRTIHDQLLRSVSSGTMAFFDTTPLGRIVNRFSKDLNLLDDRQQESIVEVFELTCNLVSYLCVVLVTEPFVLLPMLPCAYLYYRLSLFFTAANRTIRRHANVSNAPILALLTTVLSGRWSIEAYGCAAALMKNAFSRMDFVFSCSFLQETGQQWLAVRVGMLTNVIVSSVAFFGVVSINRVGKGAAASRVGLLSLSITLATQISFMLYMGIEKTADLEANMNGMERIAHYTDSIEHEDTQRDIAAAVDAHAAQIRRLLDRAVEVTVEAGDGGAGAAVELSPLAPASPCGASPTAASPAHGSAAAAGSLELEHVDMRYRPGLPLVLRDVSFAVAPGQKVGVVGRTGSGKSTLLLALLRLVEVCGGRMRVCGRDARDYGVRELRQLFSMIPQDPLLFDGTVRSNVDPFGACGDAAVWAALRQVGMEERVRGEAGGLDGRVQEGGSNYSVGQRQLLCLARALLKRGSAFLLMDEATANVDPALDRQIQLTVQHTFRDYTVVTIAHRLHTVAAYDRILVMDGGRAVEFGSPRELMSNAESSFRSLVLSLPLSAQMAFEAAIM